MIYDQPFYVGFRSESKRFRGVRNGYLPALELPEPTKDVPPDQYYFEARQLRGELEEYHRTIEALDNDVQRATWQIARLRDDLITHLGIVPELAGSVKYLLAQRSVTRKTDRL